MLCPRCNSENEMGEKFCRHCGAPLADTELFMSPKEKKIRQKELKRQEKLKRKQEKAQEKKTYTINVPDQKKVNTTGNGNTRTYTLNEKAYRRNPISMALSLFKSFIVLIVIILLVYYVGGYLLTVSAENTESYGIGGTRVPSVNYVLGDRDVTKVKYSYDKGLKVEYTFENVENVSEDLTNYVKYLMEHNNYQIEGDFNSTLPNGTVKLYISPSTINSDKIYTEINWATNSYVVTLYKVKNQSPAIEHNM